jgi:hypothetical protein
MRLSAGFLFFAAYILLSGGTGVTGVTAEDMATFRVVRGGTGGTDDAAGSTGSQRSSTSSRCVSGYDRGRRVPSHFTVVPKRVIRFQKLPEFWGRPLKRELVLLTTPACDVWSSSAARRLIATMRLHSAETMRLHSPEGDFVSPSAAVYIRVGLAVPVVLQGARVVPDVVSVVPRLPA